jgi:hypothetical protein
VTFLLLVGIFGTGVLLLGLLAGDVLDGAFDAIGIDASGGIFSTEVIGGFLAAFGLGSWFLGEAGLGTTVALAGGGAAGVAMGAAALFLTRSLMQMPTDATPTSEDLRGALGRVTTRIPDGGLGEISIRRHGHPLKLSARAESPLQPGVEVVVVEVLSTTSVLVAPAGLELPDAMDPELGPGTGTA